MQGILQQKGGFWRQNQLELSRQLLHLGVSWPSPQHLGPKVLLIKAVEGHYRKTEHPRNPLSGWTVQSHEFISITWVQATPISIRTVLACHYTAGPSGTLNGKRFLPRDDYPLVVLCSCIP